MSTIDLSARLNISALRDAYLQSTLTPAAVINTIAKKCEEYSDYNIWIYRLSPAEIQPYLDGLQHKSLEDCPLWGIPFAIKDNIDLAGIPTTAACPDYRYTPEKSAFVVEQARARLMVLVKTVLTQR